MAQVVDKDVPSVEEVEAGDVTGQPLDLESEEMSSNLGLASLWSPVHFSGPQLCWHTSFYF